MAPLIQTLRLVAGLAACTGFQVPSAGDDGTLFLSKPSSGLLLQGSERGQALVLGRERGRGPADDYNDETELHEVAPAIWPEKSPLPVTVEILIALLWVSFLSSIPLVIMRLDHKPLTTTSKMMAGVLWTAIAGGLYLFTNVILFQSAHFATLRPLTIVECIYLMSQVISTVGYGDITPALPRGQVFVAFYVISAIFVIAMLVSQFIEHLTARMEQAKKDSNPTPRSTSADDGATVVAKLQDGARAADVRVSPPVMPLLQSVAIYGAVAFVWILFFHYYPGEGKTWMEATYMSLITLSTVGFGAFTPTTEGGKVFAAFFFLLGPILLGNVVGEFGTFFMKMSENELASSDKTTHEVRVQEFLLQVRNGEVSEADFIRWGLHQQDLVPDDDMEETRVAWEMLENASHKLEGIKDEPVQKRGLISGAVLRKMVED